MARCGSRLADPNLIVRVLATNELVEKTGKAAVPLLQKPLEAESTALYSATRAFRDEHGTIDKEQFARLTAAAANKDAERVQLAHCLWALDRLGGIQTRSLQDLQDFPETGFRIHLMKCVAERLRRVRDGGTGAPNDNRGLIFSAIGGEEGVEAGIVAQGIVKVPGVHINDQSPTAQRASADALASLKSVPSQYSYFSSTILNALQNSALDDPQLRYALKVALREYLLQPGNLATLAASNSSKPPEAALADVCLAVPTPDSAQFLVGELRRTKFSTPRAGEYLKHAALYLPPEKFGEVASLTTELNDAPLAQKLALAEGLGTASRERKLPLPADATAWVQRVSMEALASKDATVVDRSIAAVRDAALPEKVEPLRAIVLRAGEHGPRRAAALEALMNTPAGVPTAAAALADPSSNTLRKKAAEVLAGAGGPEARAALLAALPTAPQELAGSIAAGLAKSPKGAEALLQLIEEGRASATLLRQKAAASALAVQAANAPKLGQHVALLTKDLPPEDARLDGVIAQRVEAFRAATADGAPRRADAAHGAQVFQQNCAVCHRFRNAGGNVGPNLDGTAARGVHRLTEDILDPNRNVDPAFRQTFVETRDGQTFVGANVREQGETLTMTDATGKDVTVAKNAIKAQTQSRLSLMPPAFEAQLSPGDFNDLLAFLLEPAK
jgi:putative heme-binding domain-containing protein